MLVLAVPGLVMALSLTYRIRALPPGPLLPDRPLLVIVYAIMFFPLAIVSVRARRSRVHRWDSKRSADRSASTAIRDVAGDAAAGRTGPRRRRHSPWCSSRRLTELTATLVLHPTGVETLATQFWAYQSNGSYSQAAPYALVMVLIAAVPGYVLGRWFDRQPERMAQAGTAPVTAPPALVAA